MRYSKSVGRKLFILTWLFALGTAVPAAQASGGDRQTSADPVGLMCNWIAYNAQKESFMVVPQQQQVFWISQNRATEVRQFNVGRVVFDSVMPRLQVGPSRVETDVPIRFTIDRITGDFKAAFSGEVGDYMREHGRGTPGRCVTRRVF